MKRITKLLLLFNGIVIGLFLLLGSYAVNPLALSPLGVTLVLLSLLCWFVLLKIILQSRQSQLQAVLLLLLLLPVSQANAQTGSNTFLHFDPIADNLRGLNDNSLWRSSFELLPAQGIAGYAPLLFRPFVSGHEVGLLVHGPANQQMLPIAIASGQLLWPGNMNLYALDAIPPHQIPVTLIAAATTDSIDGCMFFGCSTVTEIRLNENALNKLAISTAAELYLMRHPIPGVSTSDLNQLLDIFMPTDWAFGSRHLTFGTGFVAGSHVTWAGKYDMLVGGDLNSGNYAIRIHSQEFTVQTYDQSWVDHSKVHAQHLMTAPTWVQDGFRVPQAALQIRIDPNSAYSMESFRGFDHNTAFTGINDLNHLPHMPSTPIWETFPTNRNLPEYFHLPNTHGIPDLNPWPILPDSNQIRGINPSDFGGASDFRDITVPSVPDFSMPIAPTTPNFTSPIVPEIPSYTAP